MHIEINGGGLAAFGTMTDLQDEFGTLIDRSTDILSAFKTVESRTVNLNGGIGKLAEAVDNIWQRIQKEEQRIENAKDALVKAVEFGANTMRTDARVAEIVRSNKEEFYQMHPWLRPPVPETDDRNMFQKGWDLLKEGFREFGEAVGQLYENVKDTLKKAWDTIVEFYEKHKELIQKIVKTVLLVVAAVGAIMAVVSGGGLLVLVPLLTALGVSAPIAAAISATVAVVAVVSTLGSTGLNIADTWLEIDNPVFNTVQKIFNITAGVSNAMVSIGALYNAFHPGALDAAKEQLAARQSSNMTSTNSMSQPSMNQSSGNSSAFGKDVEIVPDEISPGRKIVKGDHYDDYLEFSRNEDMFTKEIVTNPQKEFVNPKDIEGIQLFDNEYQNPATFYDMHTKQEYLDFFSKGGFDNMPVEVDKVIDQGKVFYNFGEGGRHRVLAARELDSKVAVVVKRIFTR